MSTKRTGVNQPNVAGSNYPFVEWSEIASFVTDIRIGYDPKLHKMPLRVFTLDGLNGTPAERPTVLIKDADGVTVFDSTLHKPPTTYEWADTYRGFKWADAKYGMQIITAIEEAEAITSLASFTPQEVDVRACAPRQPGVTTFRVKDANGIELLDASSGNTISWFSGYNAQFIPFEFLGSLAQSGAVKATQLDLSAGLGLGNYKDCEDGATSYVRTIAGARADESGKMTFQSDRCVRITPRVEIVNSVASIIPGSIYLADDCEACCDCVDYANVYKAMSRTTRTLEGTAKTFIPMVEAYNDAQSFINDKLACLGDKNIMRVNAAGVGPGQLGVSVSLLNPSDEQIKDAVITIKVYQVLSDGGAAIVESKSPLDYGYLLRNGQPNTHVNVDSSGGSPVMTINCIQPGEASTGIIRVAADVVGLAQICVEVSSWDVQGSGLKKPSQMCVLARVNELPEE